jgi:23S rRNA pseudouridine2605 synthase
MTPEKKTLRLQKYLAQCGVCSRRKAEELIAAGRITVDGITVTAQGMCVDPSRQQVACDGKKLGDKEQPVYYLLNKPKGYVTTLHDPQGRPTVVSLLSHLSARLFPVGRLDLDTEGALLLTNDGNLAQRIQHPSHNINKTYEALVTGYPLRQALLQLEKGIVIEGRKTAPAKCQVLRNNGSTSLIKITIHEGRKRQVKKMFQAIGHPVIALKRTAYGKLTLGKLPSGHFKQLNPADLKKIFL